MQLSEWLKKYLGALIFYGLIATGIALWIGDSVYHHVHNVQLSSNQSSSRSSFSKTGSSLSVGSSATEVGSSSTISPSNSGLDSSGCYTPSTVRQHLYTNGCIDFNVGYTYTDSAGTVFIDQLEDYSQGVEVYIPYNSSAASINLSQVDDKYIKVSGYIDTYKGAPQITVTDLSQIKIYNN